MKTNNFLKYDGRVLKFLCVEVNSLYPPFFPHLNEKYGLSSDELIASGSVKRFALSYYLSSNTVELMLQKMKGSGRALGYDEPKLVVKKSKLPKNWREVQRGQTPQIYEITDLLCGNVVDVFGRYFLLVSCDPFTRGLYEEMGIQQMDVPLITEEKERVEHPIPERGAFIIFKLQCPFNYHPYNR